MITSCPFSVVLINARRKARNLVAGWELRLLLKVALELDGWRRLLYVTTRVPAATATRTSS
jgi:hypothetical protein